MKHVTQNMAAATLVRMFALLQPTKVQGSPEGYALLNIFSAQLSRKAHYLSTSAFFSDLFHPELFQGFSSSHGPFFA